MTDEQIITMLECWSQPMGCQGCSLIDNVCFDCGNIPEGVSESILNLINRQKKDIERLNNYKELYEDLKEENLETIRCIKQSIKSARAEAVREFAEKVKYYADDYNWLEMTCDHVDEIAKEMTEGE